MSGVSEVSHGGSGIDLRHVDTGHRPEPAVKVEQPAPGGGADPEELKVAVVTLNRVLDPLDLNLQIKYDDEMHGYRVKIIDRRTNEVIREIPNRGVLEAAREAIRGLFVDQLS